MTYEFRRAQRENSSVLVALAGPSGSGKTMSSLKIAQGLAGGGRIAVIDTEAGRATHYAEMFDFDHCDLRPPFSPQRYREVIEAAESKGYAVIVLDSASHEWSGDGGCHDIQADELERLAKGDERRFEALTAPAWRVPKMAHKRMMSRLLQCRSSLVFCLRAEDKIRFVKIRDDNGRERTVIEHMGFQPICEKHFMYEMTCSFLLTPDRPGVPQPIKLQEQHKAFFPLDRPMTSDSGSQLAAWARGGASPAASQDARQTVADHATNGAPDRAALLREIDELAGVRGLTKDRRRELWASHCHGASREHADVACLSDLLAAIRGA